MPCRSYYQYALNLGTLQRLRWVMEMSLAKTLAKKLQLSLTRVFRRCKVTILIEQGRQKVLMTTVAREGKAPLVAVWGGISLARKETAALNDLPPPRLNGRTELVQRLLAETCERCGSTDGVQGLTFKERLYGSPTCTICGLHSGYGGPGVKTVLPASARAKVDFRLVPNQRPDDILRKLRRHLEIRGFGSLSVMALADSVRPARTPIDHPLVQRVAALTEAYYLTQPVLLPTSAAGCVMEPFVATLGVPTLWAGIRPTGGNAHAPNEYVELASLAPAIKFSAYLFHRLDDR